MARKTIEASPLKETRVAPLSLKIKPSLKAAIVKAAQEDGRTVAQIAERILEAAMREGGYLK